MLFIILVYIVVLLALYFRKPIMDRFVPEFNAFEQKRLKIYLSNLTQNPSFKDLVNPHSQPDSKTVWVSFDPSSKHYFQLTVQDKETREDLQVLAERFKMNGKPFRWSSHTDSIEWFENPTLAKTRHIYGKSIRTPYAILGRLRSKTHFGNIPLAKKHTQPFEDKRSVVIWRGGPSGTGFHNQYEDYLSKPSREDMLKLWCNHPGTQDEIDVGLITKWQFEDYKEYLKPKMTIEEMLGYKYLLSVEGNDVATNLKWAMASKSLVLMPTPKVESWFAESQLKPWVHYVPIRDDFSDLYSMKIWCDAHPTECKDIIRNANRYVEQFTNEEREVYLFKCVMDKYLELS